MHSIIGSEIGLYALIGKQRGCGKLAFIISVLVSAVVFCLVVLLLLKVKTPRYKVTPEGVQSLLEQVLVGQAHSNDWRVFIAYEIRDNPALEQVRQQCCDIDEREYRSQGEYLLTRQGREQVRALLDQMRTEFLSK